MDPSRVDLKRVDLNLLVAFDAFISERSVTHAARRLSVGQSALIATPLAESLAKQVRDVLDQIESILADPTDFDPARAQRTFTIIASDVLSVILLKPLRARLAVDWS